MVFNWTMWRWNISSKKLKKARKKRRREEKGGLNKLLDTRGYTSSRREGIDGPSAAGMQMILTTQQTSATLSEHK